MKNINPILLFSIVWLIISIIVSFGVCFFFYRCGRVNIKIEKGESYVPKEIKKKENNETRKKSKSS